MFSEISMKRQSRAKHLELGLLSGIFFTVMEYIENDMVNKLLRNDDDIVD
jgi:hypothetical protein